MPHDPPTPITCLITTGATAEQTTPESREFRAVLDLVRRATEAGVSVVQLREKNLTARVLAELAAASARLTRGTRTRVLVNDRADVARAAACDGVHLTTRSLDAATVRRIFGPDFLVGVSAHTPEEARAARDGGADFALLGPVFGTPSKRAYGPPLGLDLLRETARALAPFAVVALGGVTLENARACLDAGARGVAAIRLFADAHDLAAVVRAIDNEVTSDEFD
jgi:thiamine-phosphate pyrophosphorylase